MHIVIDGYNLIRQSSRLRPLERRGLEAAREALIDLLIRFRRVRGHRITVIFDGQGGFEPAGSRVRRGSVEVVFSSAGMKADELIKEMTTKGDEDFLVVTSDGDIIHYVSARGGGTVSSTAFEEQLYRVIEGGDLDRRDSNEDQEEQRPPRTKKGPARRLGRKERRNMSLLRKL